MKQKTLLDLYKDDFDTEIGQIYFDPVLEVVNIKFNIDELAFSQAPLLWCDLFQDMVADITSQYDEMLDMMHEINKKEIPI